MRTIGQRLAQRWDSLSPEQRERQLDDCARRTGALVFAARTLPEKVFVGTNGRVVRVWKVKAGEVCETQFGEVPYSPADPHSVADCIPLVRAAYAQLRRATGTKGKRRISR